jgi:hypothetical protein
MSVTLLPADGGDAEAANYSVWQDLLVARFATSWWRKMILHTWVPQLGCRTRGKPRRHAPIRDRDRKPRGPAQRMFLAKSIPERKGEEEQGVRIVGWILRLEHRVGGGSFFLKI